MPNIAILIDAENVDPSFASQIFSYAHSLGDVTIREIYGSGTSLNEWGDPILEHTIRPVFTLRPNKFKNSSDIALVIGAMEILHAAQTGAKNIDAIVIASSDSDFSPLAAHLRAAGIDVIGMGEPGRLNPMWPKACTEFVELTVEKPLVRQRTAVSTYQAQQMPVQQVPVQQATVAQTPVQQIPNAQAPVVQASNHQASAPHPSVPQAEQPLLHADQPMIEEEEPFVRITPTHQARVSIIRNFIEQEIDKKGDRIKSGDLFRSLITLPDYKFDMERSKRNPLDYLQRQYGKWFDFEPGENGSYWISKKTIEQRVEEMQHQELQRAVEKAMQRQSETQQSDDKQQSQPSKESQQYTVKTLSPEEVRAIATELFIKAGIPESDATLISSFLPECSDLRAIYNRICKEFGRKKGKQYYTIVKKSITAPFEAPAETPSESPASNDATPEQLSFTPNDATPEPIAVTPEEETHSTPTEPATQEDNRYTPAEQALIEKGLEPSVAVQVQSIMSSSPRRAAYNELRKTFGNEGIRYFNLAKEIAADVSSRNAVERE